MSTPCFWEGPSAVKRDDLARVRMLLHADLYAVSHSSSTAFGSVPGPEAHEAELSFHVGTPCCDFEVVTT